MEGQSKIWFAVIGVLAVVVVVMGGIFVWQNIVSPPPSTPDQSRNINISASRNVSVATVVAPSSGKEVVVEGVPLRAQSTTAVTAKEAYDLFLAEAKKWKDDAVLVSIASDKDAALDGRSATWEAHFISQGDHAKGWKATLKDKTVTDIGEETTSAKTLTEPKFTVDSGDAIKAGLGDLGASEVKVSSMRLFQETEGGEWFWSVATDKGNITLKAQ